MVIGYEFGNPKRGPEFVRFLNEPCGDPNGSLYFSPKDGTLVNEKAFSIINGQNPTGLAGRNAENDFSFQPSSFVIRHSHHMCAMTLSPNSLHLISVAPSIRRAKS